MSGPLVGRKVYIRKGSGSPQVLIAAGRSKSLTLGATPIDVTSDDDAGWRKLLEDDAGMQSVDMSFEGISKNADFINQIAGGNFTDDYEIEIQDVCILNGRFFLANVQVTAPYNEAVTFTAELQSTGEITVENADSP